MSEFTKDDRGSGGFIRHSSLFYFPATNCTRAGDPDVVIYPRSSNKP